MKTIMKILTILTLLTKEKKKVAKKKRKVTAAMVTFNYDVTGVQKILYYDKLLLLQLYKSDFIQSFNVLTFYL